jgi:hypothetical protein
MFVHFLDRPLSKMLNIVFPKMSFFINKVELALHEMMDWNREHTHMRH